MKNLFLLSLSFLVFNNSAFAQTTSRIYSLNYTTNHYDSTGRLISISGGGTTNGSGYVTAALRSDNQIDFVWSRSGQFSNSGQVTISSGLNSFHVGRYRNAGQFGFSNENLPAIAISEEEPECRENFQGRFDIFYLEYYYDSFNRKRINAIAADFQTSCERNRLGHRTQTNGMVYFYNKDQGGLVARALVHSLLGANFARNIYLDSVETRVSDLQGDLASLQRSYDKLIGVCKESTSPKVMKKK